MPLDYTFLNVLGMVLYISVLLSFIPMNCTEAQESVLVHE